MAGMPAEAEERWLEQQLLDFSAQQRPKTASRIRQQQVYHWLLDSAVLKVNVVALMAHVQGGLVLPSKENLSRQASLHYINNWHFFYANYSGKRRLCALSAIKSWWLGPALCARKRVAS
ncbi:hypothetical protein OH492_12470 [Vibrio chagasii]|nr:hypothetical protein [Vibrio chagasii]